MRGSISKRCNAKRFEKIQSDLDQYKDDGMNSRKKFEIIGQTFILLLGRMHNMSNELADLPFLFFPLYSSD